MWPYWLFFLLPASVALSARRRLPSSLTGLHSLRLDLPWFLFVLFFTLVIGYRVQVGGDWGSYLGYLERANLFRFSDLAGLGDPGYQFVNWLSIRLGWGIWGVNLFCGLAFSAGLAVFSRSLPRPWLALTVAIPYLLTVVAMGYSRQGVALGFAMLGLVSLGRKNLFWFVVWVLVGATFHRSAVLLLPIAALAATRNRIGTAFWVAVVALLAYALLLQDEVASLYANYVEAEYQSQGALIRTAMNLVPAILLLGWWEQFRLLEGEAALWRWFALISLVLAVVLVVTPATTAVDRVALYMLPLQLFVFARLPDAWGGSRDAQSFLVIAVVAYYALVHFVWLNFASHAFAWLPYRNWLFE